MRRTSDRADSRLLARIPAPLRPLVGAAVLVGLTRLVESVVTRTSRAPAHDPDATPAPDTAPAIIRDRVLRAVLLTGALAIARRAGLAMPGRSRR